MLRKFALVIVAVSSLGVATLTPTPASALAGARLGTWMGMASRLGMGRTTFRRGAGILRRRMCRPASCPWPVETALDFRE